MDFKIWFAISVYGLLCLFVGGQVGKQDAYKNVKACQKQVYQKDTLLQGVSLQECLDLIEGK